MNIDKFIAHNPFEYDVKDKKTLLLSLMNDSFKFHYDKNSLFKKWIDYNQYQINHRHLSEFPFFPSAVFKYIDFSLNSIGKKGKTIESSGTTSQLRSRIFVDSTNSKRQTMVLSKILSFIIGKRCPYLIVDYYPNQKNNKKFSARYAGMAGYLIGAKNKEYLLNKDEEKEVFDYEFMIEKIKEFKKSNQGIVIIGYTFMIYKYLIKNNLFIDQIKLPTGSKILHFGGWKKTTEQKISKENFNNELMKKFDIKKNNIIDIYGFTEQLGTVYPSLGDNGNKVPFYSEVIIRDPDTLSPIENDKEGFVQIMSPLPYSYPGISLINDDIGRAVKRVDGSIIEFQITGRPDTAEPRGCGDTLPENFYI